MRPLKIRAPRASHACGDRLAEDIKQPPSLAIPNNNLSPSHTPDSVIRIRSHGLEDLETSNVQSSKPPSVLGMLSMISFVTGVSGRGKDAWNGARNILQETDDSERANGAQLFKTQDTVSKDRPSDALNFSGPLVNRHASAGPAGGGERRFSTGAQRPPSLATVEERMIERSDSGSGGGTVKYRPYWQDVESTAVTSTEASLQSSEESHQMYAMSGGLPDLDQPYANQGSQVFVIDHDAHSGPEDGRAQSVFPY
ncbi:hypothetical protein B0A49_09153 [Cryomyces minteri]|uniref:Uncharacterized protein n=1 Tax=Cryomyces minteri TaxID=331657 RepID=A0A4V5NHA6_9PEZI|nr:hypothetical protein B0A49_09153 [Cryomyces minteri]